MRPAAIRVANGRITVDRISGRRQPEADCDRRRFGGGHARPRRYPRAHQRSRPRRLGRVRDGDARRGRRRHHDARRHAAQQHSLDDDRRGARGEAARRRRAAATSMSASGAASSRAMPRHRAARARGRARLQVLSQPVRRRRISDTSARPTCARPCRSSRRRVCRCWCTRNGRRCCAIRGPAPIRGAMRPGSTAGRRPPNRRRSIC